MGLRRVWLRPFSTSCAATELAETVVSVGGVIMVCTKTPDCGPRLPAVVGHVGIFDQLLPDLPAVFPDVV